MVEKKVFHGSLTEIEAENALLQISEFFGTNKDTTKTLINENNTPVNNILDILNKNKIRATQILNMPETSETSIIISSFIKYINQKASLSFTEEQLFDFQQKEANQLIKNIKK